MGNQKQTWLAEVVKNYSPAQLADHWRRMPRRVLRQEAAKGPTYYKDAVIIRQVRLPYESDNKWRTK